MPAATRVAMLSPPIFAVVEQIQLDVLTRLHRSLVTKCLTSCLRLHPPKPMAVLRVCGTIYAANLRGINARKGARTAGSIVPHSCTGDKEAISCHLARAWVGRVGLAVDILHMVNADRVVVRSVESEFPARTAELMLRARGAFGARRLGVADVGIDFVVVNLWDTHKALSVVRGRVGMATVLHDVDMLMADAVTVVIHTGREPCV